MRKNELKKELNKYRELVAVVEKLEEQAKSLEKQRIAKMRRGWREDAEKLLLEKNEIERRKGEFVFKAEQARAHVQQMIDTVGSLKHNRLLCGIYIDGLTVEEVAEREGYSNRQEWRIYRDAHFDLNVKCFGERCQ